MLKKNRRVNLKTEFKRIAQGKRLETEHFVFFTLQTKELHDVRVGVAVAKKNYRHAHERNKVKRICFTVIENVMERLSKGMNLVIMPKLGITRTSTKALIDEINTLHYLYRSH